MSGRKQHFIPQFILRGFAAESKGKNAQVRVVTRDKTFLSATDGVAAERDFYSNLGEDSESLDYLITAAEGEYCEIYRELLGLPDGSVVESLKVARLIAHLAVRNDNIRDVTSVAGQYALHKAVETFKSPENFKILLGLNKSEPGGIMRKSLDATYDENREKARKIKLSRHEFRRLAFEMLQKTWEKSHLEMQDFLKAIINVDNISKLASSQHKKVLLESLEPVKRVDALAKLKWSVFDSEGYGLALPDCVAVAHDDEIGVSPVGFVSGDEMSGVLFPLSTNKMICGGTYASPTLRRTLLKDFQIFAGLSSWNFVVMNPDLSENKTLKSVIGNGIADVMIRKIQEGISESLTEALRE